MSSTVADAPSTLLSSDHDNFRKYNNAFDSVRAHYRNMRTFQTVDYVKAMHAKQK